jgi:hypothetical protein
MVDTEALPWVPRCNGYPKTRGSFEQAQHNWKVGFYPKQAAEMFT